MAKRKTKTIAKLVDDAAILMQKYVRIKAADANGYVSCVACGNVDHYKNMDGGHYISRVSIATKLMEENIHVSCKRCNKYLAGNLAPYTLYMIDTYGREFVDELQRLKHTPKKYYRSEVEEIIKETRAKIKTLEDEKA